jgi:hypothetical protein
MQIEVDDSEDSKGEDASGCEIVSGAPGSINERLQKLQEDPSDGQIKTFQQRAWSSNEFQIELHERVGEIVTEMKKMPLIDEEDEKNLDHQENLYHLIHQRDPDIIKAIIDIATIDDKETSLGTDDESKKRVLREAMLMNLKLKSLKELMNLKLKSLKEPLKDAFKNPSGAAGVKPFLSARLPFKRASRKRSAHILQVPGNEEEDICNVQLVRYFVENVWKLERPDVIISVTGGASKNFDLRPEYKEKLMRGMMDGTRKLKPWSVSIYGCISFLSVCGSCVLHHAACVRAACVRAACVFVSARLQLQRSKYSITNRDTHANVRSLVRTHLHAGL